jgi:hypothetical protein
MKSPLAQPASSVARLRVWSPGISTVISRSGRKPVLA